MVIVGTYDNVFVPQLFVFSRKDGDDVMGGPFHILPVCEVMVETYSLFPLDNRFELEATQLADNVFGGEGITSCGRESSTKFLRRQIFYRFSHVILLLCKCLQDKCESKGEYDQSIPHQSYVF